MKRNSSFDVAFGAWEYLSNPEKNVYKSSAKTGMEQILELEPLIVDDGDDTLELSLQADNAGIDGDVRDMLIIRRNIFWEIGLSLKHNHFAVKHSRLAKNLDFGYKWFGVKCSGEYWRDIEPIFSYLSDEKAKKSKWNDLPDKTEMVYIPLLTAFMSEIRREYKSHSDIPKKMVEYLLGQYDFYKVISVDNKKKTQILSFNLRGTLNKASETTNPKAEIPIASLPTRIVSLEFKPESTNTVELYLDAGWQFSFRIHNASTYVETSLKFDIQIIGMPTTIICIERNW